MISVVSVGIWILIKANIFLRTYLFFPTQSKLLTLEYAKIAWDSLSVGMGQYTLMNPNEIFWSKFLKIEKHVRKFEMNSSWNISIKTTKLRKLILINQCLIVIKKQSIYFIWLN